MAASKSRLTRCSVSIAHFLNVPFLPNVWMLIGPVQQLLNFCFFLSSGFPPPAWLASLKDVCESGAPAGYGRSGGGGQEAAGGCGGGRDGDGNGSSGAQMHISGRVLDLVTCLTPSINHLGRPLLFKKGKTERNIYQRQIWRPSPGNLLFLLSSIKVDNVIMTFLMWSLENLIIFRVSFRHSEATSGLATLTFNLDADFLPIDQLSIGAQLFLFSFNTEHCHSFTSARLSNYKHCAAEKK